MGNKQKPLKMSVRKRKNLDSLKQGTEQIQKSDFVEGAITRIKLENILTYDSVEFKTGPSLNVIIGPNGTGKSTLVCAICLGLGGKTGLLGRAQQAAEFIKYGCQKGKIELELHNQTGDNYIIHREIHKNNTSHWHVNGRQATMKAVEELVARLHIQVGNLCQFLPQEKVADFAKMTPEDLLENTEKAAGPPEMYENHIKLKDARNEAKRLEQSFGNTQERLEQNKKQNLRVEQDVKNFHERERHLERIEILHKKRPWIEYDVKRKEYDAIKQERDSKVEVLKAARVQFAPLQKRLDSITAKKENADTEIKAKTDMLREYARKAQANSKEIEVDTDKLAEIQNEFKFKQDTETARQKRIQDLRRQLEALQSELQNADNSENFQPEIDKATNEMRVINRKMSQIQQDGENIKRDVQNTRRQIDSSQSELREIQNIENRRLEILRNKHKDTYDAVLWLRENKDMFRGEVYMPIMLSVNPKDPAFAKYIETHISVNDMRAFVFEDGQDYNHFMNVIRDQQKLKVNAVKVPPDPLSAFKPRYPITHYQCYGFHHYLKDTLNCPEGVMRYLCAQYRIHNIPVGSRKTKECLEQVRRNCPELGIFYTDNNQYTFKKSKYDQSVSSRNSHIRDPSWLTASVDTKRERDLETQIQNLQRTLQAKEDEYKELQRQSRELDTAMNQLREQKRQLTQKKDEKKRLQSKIDAKRQKIRNEETEAIDLQAEKDAKNRRIREINAKKCRALQKMKAHTQKCFELITEKVRLTLKHASIVRDQEVVEEELRDQSQHLQNLERDFEQAKERVRHTKDHAKRLLDIAKKATNTAPNDELSKDLRNIFENYPSTLEDIDAQIHEEQARADSLFQSEETVAIVKEYEQRKKDIAHLEREKDSKKKALDGHQEAIEKAKQQWLGPLRSLIEKISKNFSYFFSCMNCAGEIELSTPENPEDYEKYGVRIKVKFRDTDVLRELTTHHQSGGERSVATVLYMMALQELARCPFRCVDEINQGMDPINERRVFELVVQTVCKRYSSQYFLLTPKLLPDLEYADNMTVLCVKNGPYMLNHTEWNLKKFIRRRRKIQDE